MQQKQLLDGFVNAFGSSNAGVGEPRFFFAPGRVNLIGEHIDYNGGLVLPCALDMGTYGVIRRRDDDTIRLVSGNFETTAVLSTNSLEQKPAHEWANYPKAVAEHLTKTGYTLGGFEFYIVGNLPNGAGLSSSASVTSLTAHALNELFGLGIPPVERAVICQKAEAITGVNCGIMDPFAITMGKKDHAILLNCNTLEYSQIPLKLGDYRIIIANTNRKRGLNDSKYNERRAECEQALSDLKTSPELASIKYLCDLTPADFNKHAMLIKNDIHRRRAEHVVKENARTKDAANALKNNQLDSLFHLMIGSHLSLRDLYEVACWALDAMVQPAFLYGVNPSDPPSVMGTRMTGAGFGGCTVNIVHKNFVKDFSKHVGEEYETKTGIKPDFYVAETGDGVRECVFR